MTPYTPEEIALARQVCADNYARTNLMDKSGILMVLDGQFDHWAEIQIALAAIRATTERAAKLTKQTLLDARIGEIDNDLRSISHTLVGRFQSNEHLKDRPDAG